jgi:hypothetical protein
MFALVIVVANGNGSCWAGLSLRLHPKTARSNAMIKKTGTIVLISLTLSGGAFAQSASMSPQSDTTKPAVSNPSDAAKTAAAPVPGKNSFTAKQAKKRFEKHGYSSVGDLTQDENSVWHAKAMKAGQPVNLTLDYEGNINEQ